MWGWTVLPTAPAIGAWPDISKLILRSLALTCTVAKSSCRYPRLSSWGGAGADSKWVSCSTSSRLCKAKCDLSLTRRVNRSTQCHYPLHDYTEDGVGGYSVSSFLQVSSQPLLWLSKGSPAQETLHCPGHPAHVDAVESPWSPRVHAWNIYSDTHLSLISDPPRSRPPLPLPRMRKAQIHGLTPQIAATANFTNV